MRTWLAVFLMIGCLDFTGEACVWIKGTTKEGKWTVTSGLTARSRLEMKLRHSIGKDLHGEGERMEKELRGSTRFEQRNDYAVALMYLGRPREAIDLLARLEAERPGDYATAANLGTAFELAGDNESGLRWIGEGIRRNPKSHDETEWLHVMILEGKIREGREPGYLRNHSVLDIEPEEIQKDRDQLMLGGKLVDRRDVTKALEYQLVERLQFVKSNDLVIASLVFDLAMIEASAGTLESARGLLQMAADFGYPAERVSPILHDYEAIIRAATLAGTLRASSYCLLGAAFIVYALKRKWITVFRAAVDTRPEGN